MKNKVLYFISPATLALVLLIAGIFADVVQGGWRMLGIVAGIPLVTIVAIIAIVAKLLVRGNIAMLWVTEIVLIILVFVILHHLQ
jgi:hypothetical protein